MADSTSAKINEIRRYGEEDGVTKAIEIGGIDVEAATEEVVSTDGVGHFLSHYDGNINDGPGGIVYWRDN